MFYKNFDGALSFGLLITAPDFVLAASEKDTYTYPVDGWYWFETEAEAKAFFGITGI